MIEYSFLIEERFLTDLSRKYVKAALNGNKAEKTAAKGVGILHGLASSIGSTKAPGVMPWFDTQGSRRLGDAVTAITPGLGRRTKDIAARRSAIATGRLIRHPVRSALRAVERYLTTPNGDPALRRTVDHALLGAKIKGREAGQIVRRAKGNTKLTLSKIGEWLRTHLVPDAGNYQLNPLLLGAA